MEGYLKNCWYMAGWAEELGTDGFAASRQQLQCAPWHTSLPQQAHGLGRDQRCLLGRLGQYRVAGGQGRRPCTQHQGQRRALQSRAHIRVQGLRPCPPEAS